RSAGLSTVRRGFLGVERRGVRAVEELGVLEVETGIDHGDGLAGPRGSQAVDADRRAPPLVRLERVDLQRAHGGAFEPTIGLEALERVLRAEAGREPQ